MNLDLETEFSKADLLSSIDTLKKQIDDMQLSDEIKNRVMQKLRLDWNYNSNAIEGNKLNYGETVAFLMTGITAKGKPLKDYLDIRGHNEAILFLTSIVKEDRPLIEADIRALHKMILVEPYEVKAQTADGSPTSKMISVGEYKTQANHVQTATGEIHYYSTPEETPMKMRELMEWYTEVNANSEIHPVVVAALFHHKFVEIHPFDDGNGRLSRILMNLILMKNGYPPVVIKNEDKQNYYALLSQADANNSWPFVEYIAERLESSLQLYLKAGRGEDIDEDEDIDKEIALFKMEIENKVTLIKKRTAEVVKSLIVKVIQPLLKQIILKAKQFDELFFYNILNLEVTTVDGKHFLYTDIKASEFDDLISNLNNNSVFEKIDLMFEFKEFRNSKHAFDVGSNLFFDFNEYEYEVLSTENEFFMSKLYHQELTSEEKSKIIRLFISDLKKEIFESLNK